MNSSLLTILIRHYYPQTADNVQDLVASNVLLEKISNKIYEKMEQSVQKYADIAARINVVIRMLRAWQKGIYTDVNKSVVFISAAILLYMASPLDLIPDFIPVIGGLDDLLLLRYLLKIIDKEIDKFTTWEKLQVNRNNNT
ncbi:MAG: hypothetical protein RJA25_2420 [Bacteroidota bacterium]|jgi:uncharacterized membrane protein YkvA (DUF1232 family)